MILSEFRIKNPTKITQKFTAPYIINYRCCKRIIYLTFITESDCGCITNFLPSALVLPISNTVSPSYLHGADCSLAVGFTAIIKLPLLKMNGYLFFSAYTTSKSPSDWRSVFSCLSAITFLRVFSIESGSASCDSTVTAFSDVSTGR